MKIFPRDSATATKSAGSAKAANPLARKKTAPPEKKEISESEIRQKLAARVEASDSAKNMAVVTSKKLGEGFMNENYKAEIQVPSQEIKSPNTKDLTLKSDIALNDPKDSNTQEKLKTVLSKGAFNFNPKERETLERILSER